MNICLFRDNVRLVPYSIEFDRQTVAWVNTTALRSTFGLSRTVTEEEHRCWVEAQRDFLFWAILDRNWTHCGNISLQLTPRHSSAYFQIYIGSPTDRGKGFGTTALWCVLKYGFDHLKLHRIWMHLLPGNDQAMHIYRKFGFVEEGRERSAVFRDGQFHDQLRLSLLQEEWNHLLPNKKEPTE